jgi:dipeptidyl aminopeptidase/acylaminoacyl peptidase
MNLLQELNAAGDSPHGQSSESVEKKRLSRRGFIGSALAGGLSAAGVPLAIQLTSQDVVAVDAAASSDGAQSIFDALPAMTAPRGIATLEAYQRAVNLWAVTDGKILNDPVVAHWLPGGDLFWYVINRKNSVKEYMLVNMPRGTRASAFNHIRLAESLGRLEGRKINPNALELKIIAISETQLSFSSGNKAYRCDLDTYTLTTLKHASMPVPAVAPAFRHSNPGRWGREAPQSPDGRWVVAIRNFNVYLKDRRGGGEQQITQDGRADDFFEPRVFWSPDSRKFLVLRTVPGFNRQVKELDYAVTANEAKLVSFFYQKPGDAVNITRPHLFHAVPAKEIPISISPAPTPWSITEIRWNLDSNSFTYLYNQRDHQVMRVIGVDASTGHCAALVEEICHDDRSPKFFDYSGKQFTFYLEKAGEMIWMSERDGWNHLYLYDLNTGRVKNRITSGRWVVRHVVHVDADARQIWFQAGGVFPDQDPYFVHYCRVNFDGTGLTHLTVADGTHKVEFSPDHRYIVDTWSRVNYPPVVEVRRADSGEFVIRLEQADIAELLATGIPLPQPFQAKGRDGKTDIYGVIYRPSHFDPHQRYPVIEHIYAGPQSAFVPKEFAAFHWPQTMAEIGFIVVQIDGMGTSHRSKAFHDVCWKNLGDSGFPDRIPWIQAAQKHVCPQMDLTRVGIYGTSAGGQSALRAVLAFGDFYKVASANSGCHDNRVDKIWWNEQWMSWPVGPWYAQQSNVTNAHRLHGKLQLIAGGMDHNVDPCCTMQVINALEKANKDFEFLFVPPGHHGAAGYHWQYTWRQVRDFMVRHLWGITPRHGQILPLAEATPPTAGEFQEALAGEIFPATNGSGTL